MGCTHCRIVCPQNGGSRPHAICHGVFLRFARRSSGLDGLALRSARKLESVKSGVLAGGKCRYSTRHEHATAGRYSGRSPNPADDSLRDVRAHYSGVWIGYITVAFVMGAARFSASRPAMLPKMFAWCLFASAAISSFASPMHWKATVHERTARDAVLDSILTNDLPRRGTIGTSDGPFGHLWRSRRFELGLKHLPCYALVDPSLLPETQIQLFSTISKREAGEYSVVWEKDGVSLYRRNTCHPPK